MKAKFTNPGPKGFTVGGRARRIRMPVIKETPPRDQFLKGLSRPAIFGSGVAVGGLGVGGGIFAGTRGRQELSAKLDKLIEFDLSSFLGGVGRSISGGVKKTISGADKLLLKASPFRLSAAEEAAEAASRSTTAAGAMGHAGPFASMSGSPPIPTGPGPMAGTSAPAAAKTAADVAAAKAAPAAAAARKGAVRPKMPPSVGTVGSYDIPTEAAPTPGKLQWGGETGAVQSGRAQAGVRTYLGQYNAGRTQPQAALSAAQKAGMAQRGMTPQGGGAVSSLMEKWNALSPGKKLAIGVGGGAVGGYLASSLNKDRDNRQMSARLDDIINFVVKPGMVGKSPLGIALTRAKNLKLRKNPIFLRSEYERLEPHIQGIAKHMTAIGLSGKLDNRLEFNVRKPVAKPRTIVLKQVKIFESAEEPVWFDNRPRNLEGQFTPEQGGGPNPNSMATVYKQPGILGNVTKGAALALTGGALGQVGGDIAKKVTKKGKELLKQFKKRK